ncbi:SPOR domain-containing protein [Litorivita sp. NS0012-18]|uniref:SPOR domain-containing protein n=1 Tax=Litorivita sp. NS0012-18 TaxID=3127655 RepID=UPI00310BA393
MADIRVTGAMRAPQQAKPFDPSQHPAYARPAPVTARGRENAPQEAPQPQPAPVYGADAGLHHAGQYRAAAPHSPAQPPQADLYAQPDMQPYADPHAPQAQTHPQAQAQAQAHAPRVTAGYFAPQAQIDAQEQYAPTHDAQEHQAQDYYAQGQYAQAQGAAQSGGASAGIASALLASARMPTAAGAQRAANMAGAAISLALVLGLGIWGYKLLARDVSGVPVIRAAAGPMRVAPENPGGQPADYQGFAVNQVAAEGAAAKPADRLVLAPRPVDLTAEDTPAAAGAEASTMSAPARARQIDISAGGAELPQGKLADIQALAAQLAAGSPKMDEAAPIKVAASAPNVTGAASAPAPAPAAALIEAAAAAKPKSGLARSLRPQVRPAGLKKASVSGAVEAALKSASRAGEIDAASLPVGTRLAQLGTFDTADGARAGWHKLDARFGELLEGKSLVVQQAQSGGRVFYRLRAHGFGDINEARRFCAAFVSEGVECFPVATR